MALIQCDFASDVLRVGCSMQVILPQTTRHQIGMTSTAGSDGRRAHPTLWLLHGLSDDHTTWCRRTSIERYVAPLGLAVVMPAVGRSFYADMHAGPSYWTFISEELPTIARSMFPLSDRREDNFVAGLSMGGYGAFKLALTHPELYAGAASLSGALDARKRAMAKNELRAKEMQQIFGDLSALENSGHDLFHLATNLAKSGQPCPPLYQCCGTADGLYEENIAFRDHARALDLPLTYEEDADYAHNWGYWDVAIQRVLDWLPLQQTQERQ